LAINTHWGGFEVALMSLEGGFGWLFPAILHSAFCIRRFEKGALQHAKRYGGGMEAVWRRYGGGLTWVAQGSDI
jgi:hypothetical protein